MASRAVQFTLAELARRLGGELTGDGALVVRGVNTLDDAGPHEITFIINPRYAHRWAASRAGAAIVNRDFVDPALISAGRPLIAVASAELASLAVLELFKPPEPVPDIGRHPTAWVHPEASVHATARLGPHVSVDARAVVEADVVLHAGVRLYADTVIGAGSVIHANTVVRERCSVGRRVLVAANVSIGFDGFGFRPAPDGSGLLKAPHLGAAVIEDDVEIGAGSCVDRGKFGDTVVGRGTKIDNLVQVSHNVRIGRNCVIAALCGIGGSTKIGDWVQVGGDVGISDHLTIGNGAKIGAGSGVIQDVPAGETHVGYPAHSADKTLREWVAIRKLPDHLHEHSRAGTARE